MAKPKKIDIIEDRATELSRMFVISDIHVGHNKFDGRKGELLLSFLDHVKAEGPGTGLIINGDFLELQQSKVDDLLSAFDNILEKLFELMNDNIRVWYLVGNHDIKLQNFKLRGKNLNIRYPRARFRIGGKLIHVEHGHFSDKYFRRFTYIYIFGTILLGYAMRLIPRLGDRLGTAYNYLVSLKYKHSISPRSKKYAKKNGNMDEYESDAKKLLDGTLKRKLHQVDYRSPKQSPCDVVIFGHTHKPVVSPHENSSKFYLNCGDWLEKSTYVQIEEDKIYLGNWPEKADDYLTSRIPINEWSKKQESVTDPEKNDSKKPLIVNR